MYKYLFPLLAVMLLNTPHAHAAPVEESEGVQEPDQADNTMAEPPVKESKNSKADKKAAKPGEKSKDSAKEGTPADKDKKPADKFEGGYNTVILQGLNKVTAHYSRIEAIIGSTVRFGTLEIIARSCWKSAPDERPENAVLLEIYEIKQGEPPEKLFLGWMFSSSPGLSSLENPFYDITVVNCDKTETGKL